MRYYDNINKCLLIFHETLIDDNYWDLHWQDLKCNKKFKFKFNPKSLVSRITKKFLEPEDGRILEGGCGLGDKVYTLKMMNYDVIGVDNAKETINFIKRTFPQLNIIYGDLRKIDFPDHYFAGYWSLGVIEHFFEGYQEILLEMYRVIKPNGFLFLTFPYMSPFRKFKARSNLYKLFSPEFYDSNKKPSKFYQFILNENNVIKDFINIGFELKHFKPFDGIKGFKDEIFFLKFYIKRFLALCYNLEKPKFIRKIKRVIDKVLTEFSAHMMLLVFQKT